MQIFCCIAYRGGCSIGAMKTIGVLGGMGPEATAEFFFQLIACDPCARDQDHVHIVVECDPSIPDRTAFILGRGEDPLPSMVLATERLRAAGAQIAGIPCITAHCFLPRLRALASLPFISALEAMETALCAEYPGIESLGILGTAGSKAAGIYEANLKGRKILWPGETIQHGKVMEAIYGSRGIKAGFRGSDSKELLLEAAAALKAQGAQAIVAGCTEVPLVLSQDALDLPFIDPMRILAKALVAAART
ncbi:MAG: aspartate racemase [Spirochaetes bacterium]|nr:MAG: aspartate racemase [Spirochaetota bacterium]